MQWQRGGIISKAGEDARVLGVLGVLAQAVTFTVTCHAPSRLGMLANARRHGASTGRRLSDAGGAAMLKKHWSRL